MRPATTGRQAVAGPHSAEPLLRVTLLDNKRISAQKKAKFTPACRGASVAASSAVSEREGVDRVKAAFDAASTEAEFLGTLQSVLQHPKAPDFLLPAFQDFFSNYKNAVLGSGVSGADERRVTEVMSAIADRVVHEFVEPFTFPNHHQRILSPYNYYEFGQNYVRNLIDFANSVVGNLHTFDRIEELLSNGENVVMLANHQTEADPAVWALLLERTHPRLATDVHYVAGDRVVADPLCKPFSMGRNLFCVHSKKHMEDDPLLREPKIRTNRQTVVSMSRQLNRGGLLLWIAPSGGRDRPDAEMRWAPARFDPSAVELMRHLAARAKPPGHLFPLAMHSGEMMPPPRETEKSLGERRLTFFTGVGISAGEELDVDGILSGVQQDAAQTALAEAAWRAVSREYERVHAAIKDPSRREGFVQPWSGK